MERQASMNKPTLKLIGVDGNAFMLLAFASKVAKAEGMDWASIRAEATSGDYDHLLSTLDKYFDIE